MICPKCGSQIGDNAKFCRACGAPVAEVSQPSAEEKVSSVIETSNITSPLPPTEVVKISKGSSKRKLIVIIASGILLIGIAVAAVLLLVNNGTRAKVNNFLTEAEKYLIEMDYEQAIIAFDKALEIDPNNAYAYIGKAEALTALGKDDDALKTLKKGYKKTDDERIADKLEEYEGDSPTPGSSSSIASSINSTSGHKPDNEPTDSPQIKYVDASKTFSPDDRLSGTADGTIVNVLSENEWGWLSPAKSFYIDEKMRCNELDMVFGNGIYWTEYHGLVGGSTPELVYNSGTQHVYKATKDGAVLIKTSPYPMYVTQDGYIAYYESRTDSSVTVNIESPTGETISSTTIVDAVDYMHGPYGTVVDRLSHTGNGFTVNYDMKGAQFVYNISEDGVPGILSYSRYLFYSDGRVILDNDSIPRGKYDPDYDAIPKEIKQSGQTYLFGNYLRLNGTDKGIGEYYDYGYEPEMGMDGYFIAPEHCFYALLDTKAGRFSKIYKDITACAGDLYVVTTLDGKKGYIDSNGNEAAMGYDDVGEFIGDYSYVCKDGDYYIIDRQFNQIAKVDGTNVFVLGSKRFSCVRNNKVYLFDVNTP